MYIDRCTSFPYCLYTIRSLDGIEKIKNIGKQAIWSTTVDKSGTVHPLDSVKYVMIAYCKDDNKNEEYCIADTSIYTDLTPIYLVENEKFFKFCLKGDKGILKIDLKGDFDIESLTVDIMIFNGELKFNIRNESLLYDKYYLANKIFIQFNQLSRNELDSIEIEYIPLLDSFFSVKYGTNKDRRKQITEIIRSGENYLVQIDPNKLANNKTIYLENYRHKEKNAYLAQFNALNCKFKVIRDEKEIAFFDD